MGKLENMNDSLWGRIESLMKSQNLTQKEFAAEIGVNPVTITEWKKGKSHSYQKIDTMRRIADALGVSIQELTKEKLLVSENEGGEVVICMFWRNFVRLCGKVNKSPARVANELGLSNAVATSWKKGTMPRDSTLLQIADYFGVSVESLTAETPPVLDKKAPPAPKSESGQSETMAQIIETAGRLQPVQQEFLLAFLKTVVQNTPAETLQSQRSRTISPAAVSAGDARANASIHP